MKRLHLHVAVEDLDRSIGFYSTLFGVAPTVRKGDYAKWMLEDPRVNFAISSRSRDTGLDHVGIQTDGEDELSEITARLKAANAATLEEANTTCCYARSDKTWVVDPSGLRWETFVTHGDSTTYGAGPSFERIVAAPQSAATSSSCCG